jgi:hypothetical protein
MGRLPDLEENPGTWTSLPCIADGAAWQRNMLTMRCTPSHRPATLLGLHVMYAASVDCEQQVTATAATNRDNVCVRRTVM